MTNISIASKVRVYIIAALSLWATLGLISFLQIEKNDAITKKITISHFEHINTELNKRLKEDISLKGFAFEDRIFELDINHTHLEPEKFATIDVTDKNNNIIYSTNTNRTNKAIEDEKINKTEIIETWKKSAGDEVIILGGDIRDKNNQKIASHVISIDTSKIHKINKDLNSSLLYWLIICKFLAGITLGLGIYGAFKYIKTQNSIRVGIVLISLSIMTTTGLIYSSIAADMIYSGLNPSLQKGAEFIAKAGKYNIEKGFKDGEDIYKTLDRNKTIAGHQNDSTNDYIFKINANDNLIYSNSDGVSTEISSKTPINININNKKTVAELEVYINKKYYNQILFGAFEDLAIIFIVGIIFFNEVIGWYLFNISTPDPKVDLPRTQLPLLRLPLFIFILTEELTKSFLPLRIKELALTTSNFSEGLISIPITIYMLVFAICTPFGGKLSDKYGSNIMVAFGSIISAIGFLWGALTVSFYGFTAARCLNAAGYALLTMAVQRIIMSESDSDSRTKGLAMFIGAAGIAAICGSSLGGVIAQHLGYDAVFLLSATLCVLSNMFFICITNVQSFTSSSETPAKISDLFKIIKDNGYMILMICGSIPNKIALAGILYYITPLYLSSKGYETAETGRLIMTYYICLIATTPITIKISIKYSLKRSLVFIGGLLIGIGAIFDYYSYNYGTIIFVCALGIGTGLSAASLQSLATESFTSNKEISRTSLMSGYRTIERLGSAIGPIVAGFFVIVNGYGFAMIGIGTLILGSTIFLGSYNLKENRAKNKVS